MRRKILMAILALAIAASALFSCTQPRATAKEKVKDETLSQQVGDAMITTRIKTAYLFNPHLNSFRINVDTQQKVVVLQGVVRTGIQKDLAEEIAKNANEVRDVRNELQVSEGAVSDPEEIDRTFSQAVLDATTTASVKTALALTRGVKATEINVTTRWGTVTLAGAVSSKDEKELAEETARKTEGVKAIENRLEVRG